MSRVDLIVPCYNYAQFLGQCLQSILTQSHGDLRVLIIDDASQDSSPEVAARMASSDGRVEFRPHPANRGHIATYNEGLEWASGDYVMILSADDMLVPGALLRAAQLLDAHPEVGLVYGRAIMTGDPAAAATAVCDSPKWKILPGRDVVEAACAAGTNVIPTQTAIVRTALQKKLGGYHKELPHAGDMEMWLRFAIHSDIGALDADQGFYRVHGTNMHIQSFGAALARLRQQRDAFQTLFREQGAHLPDAQRVEGIALRRVALDGLHKAGLAFDAGDADASLQLLEFAMDLDPQLPGRPEWRHLRMKRLLGARLWPWMRPLVSRIRGKTPPPAALWRRIGLFPAMA